jgi:hypothetical protein
MGLAALGFNTTGSNNTTSGFEALNNNTTGNNNTAVGYKALFNATAGSRNTAIGWGAGAALKSGNFNLYLGHPGAATESATLRLGDVQARAFIVGVAGKPIVGTTVVINSAGQLGTVVSSARYKRDIQDMGAQSQKLWQLRPVTFRYKQDAQGQRQYGLIAEEVAKVYPELVTKGTDGKIESVQYQELIPLLLNEVQHRQQELTALHAQNAQLQETLAQRKETIMARLAQLEGKAHVATLASR